MTDADNVNLILRNDIVISCAFINNDFLIDFLLFFEGLAKVFQLTEYNRSTKFPNDFLSSIFVFVLQIQKAHLHITRKNVLSILVQNGKQVKFFTTKIIPGLRFFFFHSFSNIQCDVYLTTIVPKRQLVANISHHIAVCSSGAIVKSP